MLTQWYLNRRFPNSIYSLINTKSQSIGIKVRYPAPWRAANPSPSKRFDAVVPNESHSNFAIRLRLTFAFTTPPTPNAGTILHILAAALTAQFFLTIAHLSPQLTPLPPLLYRSRPSRCMGVDKSCTDAGARNCATVCPLKFFWISALMLRDMTGPSSGGTLNEANIVRQSRSVKST